MQIKSKDGSIINVPTKPTIDINQEKQIEEINITKEVNNIEDPSIKNEDKKEEKDPLEQWDIAKKLINMPIWELKYRFGYDDLKSILFFFDYDDINYLITNKSREELFMQGDIITLKSDNEEKPNKLHWAVLEMIANPKEESYLICMHCVPTNKITPIKYSKSIKVCGKPIKVKIDNIEDCIGHAWHIKLGW